MTDQEFENIIKKSFKTSAVPSRESFTRALSSLETPVTKNGEMRYNRQTGQPSNIINNKFASFIAIWKSRRIVLVPSLVLLLFVGAFSLSGQSGKYNLSIEQLAQRDAIIEELDFVDEDEALLSELDEPYIDEFSTIQDEI
ncbi:MAG: hypothetical protein AAB895_02400 [Patescibacteria group bacterium]